MVGPITFTAIDNSKKSSLAQGMPINNIVKKT